ncbi:hypothetical protein GTA08_BOTSDO09195 [Neofusicoccum parvum]|uniref:Uncharacterized protein n=1 Tax=Neofusicoccum parvum TaxID=310453 RepID=A0ACB5S8A5_9PEZI|nr:hypothetical protein GTA08_BOTSDO09195 [Neofusicoccum parvum]
MRPSTSSSTSSSSSLLLTSPPPPPKPQPTYTRTGIGGAGNWHKTSSIPPVTPTAAADRPPSPLLVVAPRTCCKTGIGGAGNVHAVSRGDELGLAAELARSRAVVDMRVDARAAFHVGIGGAGNFRCREGRGGLRARRSAGVLGGRVEEGEEEIVAAGRRGEWEGGDEVEEVGGCAYYSNEPLPYGALDVLRRRLEQTFSRGRGVLAAPGEKGPAVRVGGVDGQERRFLRSHRSMWRF